MTLTLLIDLDDTLLQNDIDGFVPVYLKELGKHLGRYISPDRMIPQLLSATRAMILNNSASHTLEETFDLAFYPALGLNKMDLLPVLEQFYDHEFPKLEYLTSQRPDAVRLIEYALAKDHKIVIATNPLFPRKAIFHRLAWAGLDPAEIRFKLITTYEHFHFAKPNPAYYAEILAQLGWPNQPAVMVGNNIADDLLPAAQVGLPGYWVNGDPDHLPPGLHPYSAAGALSNIPEWLEEIETVKNWNDPQTPPSFLAKLKSTPAAMDTILKPLNSDQWLYRQDPDQWSLTEIICHMRDVDREVNLPRFQSIIEEDNPFVAGINSDTWAEERSYQLQSGPEALKEFVQVREEMVAVLASLPPEAWKRTARHAIFGPTHLAELVSFVTTHDCSHIQSILSTTNNPANG